MSDLTGFETAPGQFRGQGSRLCFGTGPVPPSTQGERAYDSRWVVRVQGDDANGQSKCCQAITRSHHVLSRQLQLRRSRVSLAITAPEEVYALLQKKSVLQHAKNHALSAATGAARTEKLRTFRCIETKCMQQSASSLLLSTPSKASSVYPVGTCTRPRHCFREHQHMI